jgi:RNA polymerase sigma factor for flagellar operon FliA
LPERLRVVVVGCFFEERPMLELAKELGVTESRVSQMKAEALNLLREGLDATLETEETVTVPAAGRVARRKAAYFAAVAAGSSYRDRLDSAPRPVQVSDQIRSAS